MLIPVLMLGKRHCLVIALAAALMGALIAPLLGVLAAPAAAQQSAPPATALPQKVRIATWNLAGSIPPKLVRRFERRKSIWRTTFGPRTAPTPTKKIKKLKIKADVIALQSVSDLRVVRRLFPARQFHTIVSRQLLLEARRSRIAGARGHTAGTAQQRGSRGTTAIVIRRASLWRATKRQHLMRFAGASFTGPTIAHRAAAIAIRIARANKAFWMLSLDLAPPCIAPANKSYARVNKLTRRCVQAPRRLTRNARRPVGLGDEQRSHYFCSPVSPAQGKASPDCNARSDQISLLRDWIDQKRATGEDVVIAGSFWAPPKPGRLRVPNTMGRNLQQFPVKGGDQTCAPRQNPAPPAGSNHGRQSVADMILVDVAKRGAGQPVSKYWIVPNPNAKHCPLLLDVVF